MIRALVFVAIGFTACWLYLEGDLDGIVDLAREGVNSTATVVKDATEKNDIQGAYDATVSTLREGAQRITGVQ
jgi:hypothetical protein